MKIILCKNTDHNFTSVWEFSSGLILPNNYVALSEVLDVEFTMLPYGEAEKQEIEQLDNQISKVLADTEVKVSGLKQRKAELLAIGNEVME